MWSRTNSKTMFLSCLIIGSISKDSRTPWSLCFWAATNKAEETKFCNSNSKQRKKKIIQNSYSWLKKRLGGFHQFLPWSTMNVPTSLSLKKNLGIYVLDSPSAVSKLDLFYLIKLENLIRILINILLWRSSFISHSFRFNSFSYFKSLMVQNRKQLYIIQ